MSKENSMNLVTELWAGFVTADHQPPQPLPALQGWASKGGSSREHQKDSVDTGVHTGVVGHGQETWCPLGSPVPQG